MTNYSSVGLTRQLYYPIRPNNSENTLHAWMHHILAYLTNRNELPPDDTQGPPLQPNTGCDGSCDCQSNLWVHEVSYEEHYRKLLMSRVNVGDANHVASVDEESLRREALLVMESANQHTNTQDQPVPSSVEESTTLMHVDTVSSVSSEFDDWDFVMYGSDLDSEDDPDDMSYKEDDTEVSIDGDNYTSEDSDFEDDDGVRDDDEMSEYVYDVSMRYSTAYQLELNRKGISRKCRELNANENLVADEYDCPCRKSDE